MVESVPGEMEALSAAGKSSMQDKQDFWSMCQYNKVHKGWSDSRCKASYIGQYGVWPKGLTDVPKQPDIKFERAQKAQLIKYLRGKEKNENKLPTYTKLA